MNLPQIAFELPTKKSNDVNNVQFALKHDITASNFSLGKFGFAMFLDC